MAIFVVVTHCVVIFWPRKPLNVPLDDNGQPMLWRNETEQKKDVACVWWDEADGAATSNAKAIPPSAPLPVTSFSETVRPLSEEAATQSRRSAA
ncbi:MAG TPA: hypothetical protein VK968_19350 [Roseimicrobium sp.]|nr:hypothetical protein [Roseimicrobium sp.]